MTRRQFPPLIANTELVREVRVVERNGRTFAFYRYVGQKSPVWRSVRVSAAKAALASGYLTCDGFAGPAVEHVPKEGETDA